MHGKKKAGRMEAVASLGYRGIELVATHPMGYPVEALIGLVRSHGLPVVSLLSGWSYANEGLCLSSPDPVALTTGSLFGQRR